MIFLIPFFAFIFFKLNIYAKTIGILIIGTQLTSYCITALGNPGFPKRFLQNQNENLEKGIVAKQCEKCLFYHSVDEETFHCFDCQICVSGIFFLIFI